MIAKKTGTRISTWIVEVIMPPTIGAAIGFITSEPMPLSHRIGARLSITTATVTITWHPPSMTTSSADNQFVTKVVMP